MDSEYNIFILKELKYVVDLFELPNHTQKNELVKELVDGGYTAAEVKI